MVSGCELLTMVNEQKACMSRVGGKVGRVVRFGQKARVRREGSGKGRLRL